MEALNRTLSALIMFAALTSCGGDEVFEIPDEFRGDPFCALVTGTYGYFEDGSKRLVADWDENVAVGGCVCSTHEEIATGVHDEEINERALQACLSAAAELGYVSNECQEHYDAGQWLGNIRPCVEGGICEEVPPPELRCTGG